MPSIEPASRQRLLRPLLVVFDGVALFLAVWIAFRIRFDPASLEVKSQALFEHPFLVLFSVLVAYVSVALAGLYESPAFASATGSVLRTAATVAGALLGLTFVESLSLDWQPGRGILLLSLLVWATLVYLIRRAANRWSPRLGLMSEGQQADTADSLEIRLLRLLDISLGASLAVLTLPFAVLSRQPEPRLASRFWQVALGRDSLVGPDRDRASLAEAADREQLLSIPPGFVPWVAPGSTSDGSLEEDLVYARERSVSLYLQALVHWLGRWLSALLSAGGEPAEPAPLSSRLVDGATVVFALWTLTCHAVVFFGGVFQNLLAAWALVVFLATWCWLASKRRTAGPTRSGAPAADFREESEARLLSARRVGLALAAIALVVVATSANWILRWAAVMAVLLFGLISQWLWESSNAPPAVEPARAGKGVERWLWCLTLLAVVVSLLAHRPDFDDALYVNFAVSALDLPQWQLLGTDVMHGIPELPLHLSLYRLHSIELWNALLAWLTGLSPIQTFHWVGASMGAALVPLAAARLFRQLVPSQWPAAVSFYVLILLTIGDHHRWYGNFAFVRIWQGKGVLLFVFLPLVWVHAMSLARRTTLRNWLWLSASMIAAVGASSTALWVGPVTALCAVAAVRRPSLRTAWVLVLAAASAGYIVAAGLSMKQEVAQILSSRLPRAVGQEFTEAVTTVLGESRLFLASVLVLLVTWILAPSRQARRFAIVACTAVWAILLNPFVSSWMVANVTGAAYWRGFWALPLPVLMSLVLVAPLGWRRVPVWLRWGTALAAAATLTLWVPRVQVLSSANRVAIQFPPTLKVPESYMQARRLTELAPPRSFVVVPETTGTWITTFRHHLFPVTVRHYLGLAPGGPMTAQELEERMAMTAYVGAESDIDTPLNTKVSSDQEAAYFFEGLDRYRISAVCLHTLQHPDLRRARTILRRRDFELREQHSNYEIWIRDTLPLVSPDPG